MTEVELVEARKEIVLLGMAIRVVEFSNGGTNLERFLPKNQHSQTHLSKVQEYTQGNIHSQFCS